jgi:hypothetical protein
VQEAARMASIVPLQAPVEFASKFKLAKAPGAILLCD